MTAPFRAVGHGRGTRSLRSLVRLRLIQHGPIGLKVP
jgi:hypothetical protein